MPQAIPRKSLSRPAKSARAATRPNLAQARQVAARRTAAAAKHATGTAAKQAPTPLVKLAATPAAKPMAASATAITATAELKVVRDGFTMPQSDYDMLKALKIQCLAGGLAVKKSELLRAGVQALAAMRTEQLIEKLRALPEIKAGRKKKKE